MNLSAAFAFLKTLPADVQKQVAQHPEVAAAAKQLGLTIVKVGGEALEGAAGAELGPLAGLVDVGIQAAESAAEKAISGAPSSSSGTTPGAGEAIHVAQPGSGYAKP